jgi:hypothetical protein
MCGAFIFLRILRAFVQIVFLPGRQSFGDETLTDAYAAGSPSRNSEPLLSVVCFWIALPVVVPESVISGTVVALTIDKSFFDDGPI